jgi:hypothetical protein
VPDSSVLLRQGLSMKPRQVSNSVFPSLLPKCHCLLY